MKQIPFLIFLFLISCANNSDQIEGAWSMTSANVNGNFTNSQGQICSDIIFQNDSILNFESQFFRGEAAQYKIDGDSIEFSMEGNPKYHFSIENDVLVLDGHNTIRGCSFGERKIYKRIEYDYLKNKIITQDTINHYQLSYGSWCRDDITTLEKYVSSEKSQITKNMYDSSGVQYFPNELDFNSSDLAFNSNLKFSIETQEFTIDHYNGHKLLVFFQSNDTAFYMTYSLCEDRIIELH